MGPARRAVLRNVLVADVGKVVHTIDIVPDEGFWELFNVLERSSDVVRAVWLADMAWVVWINVLEVSLGFSRREQESKR